MSSNICAVLTGTLTKCYTWNFILQTFAETSLHLFFLQVQEQEANSMTLSGADEGSSS